MYISAACHVCKGAFVSTNTACPFCFTHLCILVHRHRLSPRAVSDATCTSVLIKQLLQHTRCIQIHREAKIVTPLPPILINQYGLHVPLIDVNKSDGGGRQMHSCHVCWEMGELKKMSHFGKSSAGCVCVFSLHPHGRDQPRMVPPAPALKPRLFSACPVCCPRRQNGHGRKHPGGVRD